MFKAHNFEKVSSVRCLWNYQSSLSRNCGNNPYTEVKICINTKKKCSSLKKKERKQERKKERKKENSNSLNLNEVMPRH